MGRTASGVRGIKLENDKDRVIGMVCVTREDSDLLVVSKNGFGKRSSIEDYRITKRGGNSSMIHIDWMIGSNEIDVDGIDQNGNSIPVFRKGEWAN